MNNLINQFLKTLKNKNTATQRNYKFYLERFLKLTKISGPEDITPTLISSYRLKLNKLKNKQGKSLSPVTQNYHLIALRAFLKFLNLQKINNISYKKIYLFSHKTRKKLSLENNEIEKILEAPEKVPLINIIKKRDKAILETLHATGLKVSKLCSLERDEINNLNLSHQAKYWINQYLNERDDNSKFLFIRHDRARKNISPLPLTTRSIQRIIKRYAKKAGINKKVTPETLRTP